MIIDAPRPVNDGAPRVTLLMVLVIDRQSPKMYPLRHDEDEMPSVFQVTKNILSVVESKAKMLRKAGNEGHQSHNISPYIPSTMIVSVAAKVPRRNRRSVRKKGAYRCAHGSSVVVIGMREGWIDVGAMFFVGSGEEIRGDLIGSLVLFASADGGV